MWFQNYPVFMHFSKCLWVVFLQLELPKDVPSLQTAGVGLCCDQATQLASYSRDTSCMMEPEGTLHKKINRFFNKWGDPSQQRAGGFLQFHDELAARWELKCGWLPAQQASPQSTASLQPRTPNYTAWRHAWQAITLLHSQHGHFLSWHLHQIKVWATCRLNWGIHSLYRQKCLLRVQILVLRGQDPDNREKAVYMEPAENEEFGDGGPG